MSEPNWKMRAIKSVEKAAERGLRIEQLEQQLAQAQADAATMRALLEVFAATEPTVINEVGMTCGCCGGVYRHSDKCAWVKARAFLAAHPTA